MPIKSLPELLHYKSTSDSVDRELTNSYFYRDINNCPDLAKM